MHPFYGPSARLLEERGSRAAGIVSMGAYLAFWAAVVGIGIKMANERFPVRGSWSTGAAAGDEAVAILRSRYARGELDRDTFLRMRNDLDGPAGSRTARSPAGGRATEAGELGPGRQRPDAEPSANPVGATTDEAEP